MRFEVLGPLVVRTRDGAAAPAPEPKVRALLAALLVRAGRPVPVDTLVDDLWGDRLPSSPGNSLQTKVSQLRRTLEAAEPGGRGLVARGPAGYELRVSREDVDADRFASLASRAYDAGADPRTKASLLTDALALWRGPAYADFRDADFVRETVAHLDEQRLTAQETLAELRLGLGEHALLADELAPLVAREPLRERLRGTYLTALYRSGRTAEALESYRDLRLRLADEHGIDPGPELGALHEAMLRQDVSASPAVSAVARPLMNLPAQVTGLIGREQAVKRVRELIMSGRLVTLTGPGGVGKTRLALESAAALAEHFPDGIHLAELAGTRGEVTSTVAAALGIRDDAPADPPEPEPGAASASSDGSTVASEGLGQPGRLEQPGRIGQPGRLGQSGRLGRLGRALAGCRLLLVLDNCEHVLGPAADLAAELLRHAPHLRILATSQEPLALSGEIIEAVAPLGEEEALRLFATRAAATAPGFVLDDGNREAAALICRRLDGIPLAVELAATRVRALGVHALADRLHDRFRLLNQVRRDAPARQRTLRAMIDWSWELLTPPERRALRQLAVFSGDFTLESAEEVLSPPESVGPESAGPESVGPEAAGSESAGPEGVASEVVVEDDVLDLVTRLVDRSLLTPAPGATPEIRYRMLESVTAYGLERLDKAAETATLRRRHAHHFAALAERGAAALRGPGQRSWLRRLDREAVNLRAALEWSADEADATTALRLVNALTWYWFLRGRLREAMRSLDLALNLTSEPQVHATDLRSARTAAASAHAAFALLTGEETCAHGLTCEREATTPADARSRWLLAFARCGFDHTASEDARVDALLAEFRAAGDRWGEAAALSTRATRALYRGDLVALRDNATRSAALFTELGDRWGQLQSSEQLGVLAEIAADYDEAARLQRDGLRGAEELELWTDLSFRLSRLGRLALLTGDDPAATDHHQRAARLAAQQSHRPAQQFAETGLAIGARHRGDLDTAEELLVPWLDFNRRFGVDSGTALILAQLGYVAEQRGDAPRAEELHRDGLAVARTTGDERAVALALEGLAGARALADDPTHAAELLGTAAALREAAGAPLPPAERKDVGRALQRIRATHQPS
ncbi:ATP-binding protein [Streptomyces formicae]|uniref:Putative AfsR-like transcriptional regulator n=1 Tax=Streptomyces formicae TaxID=1616117 RepID=A0A291QE15_9ACTN|nr:BTAD domain-containing putative transcriptional regulator [Streptomyces formicae]ATL29951.1 putative AfsR-like transcriptional regulator [Streptomyces formicae]